MNNKYNVRKTVKGVAATAILLSAGSAFAQSHPVNPMEYSRPMPPEPPVYLANYKFLKDPSKRTDFFDPIRYIPIGKTSWLQLGGGLRYGNTYYGNSRFGYPRVPHDGWAEMRYQVHADLHLFNDAMRTFVQIENTRVYNKNQKLTLPIDRSGNEIHQAFFDVRMPSAGHDHSFLRVGRQEMMYGSGALFSLRVVPNVRRTFDGARYTYRGAGGNVLNAFAMRPVGNIQYGDFNDSSHDQGDLYGLYGTLNWGNGFKQDLYAINFRQGDFVLNGLKGEEKVYTVGTRLFGRAHNVHYSWDLIYQFGKHAGQDVRAWAVHSNTGYRFSDVTWKPDIALRFDAASGDRNPNDNESNTFNPLFPANGKMYGGGGLTTLSNLIAVGPQFIVSPTRHFQIRAKIFEMWRQSEKDAVYVVNMHPLVPTEKVSGRRFATDYDIGMRWRATQNLTLVASYTLYDVTGALEKAGGKDSRTVTFLANYMF